MADILNQIMRRARPNVHGGSESPASDPPSYDAFISYSHAADGQLAPKLQTALERYAVAWYRRPILRIFRDQTNLSATPHAWPMIETNLDRARFLILMASPDAAASKWVRKEVEHWLLTKGAETLLIVLTAGNIVWDDTRGDFDWARTTALPDALKGQFHEEPLHVDLRNWGKASNELTLRNDHFAGNVLRLAAPLHGKPMDELSVQAVRELTRRIRHARIAVGLIAVLAISSAAAAVRIDSQNEALRKSFVDTQLSLGSALIREGRMADGIWRYWLAYENATSRDPARQSALNLIGSWSQLAGRPLVHDSALRQVMFSRESDVVLTLTDRAAQLWNIRTGEPIGGKIAASQTPWQAVAVSPDAANLIVARNASADIWDIRTGKRRGEPLAHGDNISKVAISADGTTILTQSKGLIRFWNANTGKTYRDIILNSAQYATLSPNGKSVFLGFDAQRLVDISSGKSTRIPFWPHNDRGNHMAMFSPDGRLLVAAGKTNEEVRDYEHAELWRVGSSKPIKSAISHRGSFTTIAFSSDSRMLLTGGHDNIAVLWPISDDGLEGTGPRLKHEGSVVSAAFGQGGSTTVNTVVTGSTDTTARLWKIHDLKTVVPISYTFRHGGSVDSVAISANGRTVLTGSSDGIARIWDPYLRTRASNSESSDAKGRSDADEATLKTVIEREPSAAAISPDKRLVAIRGEDNTVKLRNMASGKLVGRPLQHRGPVLAVAFSPDSRFVATGSADNTAAVWDAGIGTLIGKALNLRRCSQLR